MNKNNTRWTTGEVIKGKTFSLIILTVISTYLLNKGATKLWSNIYNFFDKTLYNGVRPIGGFFEVLLVIPAIAISIWIIKGWLQLKHTVRPVDDDMVEHEKSFTWYNYYGMACGYGIFILVGKMSRGMFGEAFDPSRNRGFIASLIIFAIPFVVAIVGTNIINSTMIKKTHTNEILLADIYNGFYNDKFSDETERVLVFNLLAKGKVASIGMAKQYLLLKAGLKKIAGFGKVIGGLIFVMTLGVVNVFTKEMSSGLENTVGNAVNGMFRGQTPEQRAYYESEQRKKDAQHKAYLAGKKAHEEQYYADQARRAGAYGAKGQQDRANVARNNADNERYKANRTK